jgi:hypothetical protein
MTQQRQDLPGVEGTIWWMDTATPLSPGARFVWERAMAVQGRLGGGTRPAFGARGKAKRGTTGGTTEGVGGCLTSHAGAATQPGRAHSVETPDCSHNAGVAGSSPAPAIDKAR